MSKLKAKSKTEKAGMPISADDFSLPSDSDSQAEPKKAKMGRPLGSTKAKMAVGKPILGELVTEGVQGLTQALAGDNEKLSLGERKLLQKVGDSYEQYSGFEVGENLGKHGLWVLLGVSLVIVANHFFMARRRALAQAYVPEDTGQS